MQTTAAHRPEPALLDDDGIGDWLYNELMGWFGPEDDPFSIALAGSVGGRLNACRSARPLTVVPLFHGVPLAFIAPGRYVYVTRGLLHRAVSPDAVALAVGHEMAHHDLGHTQMLGHRLGWLRKVPGSFTAVLFLALAARTLDGPDRETAADELGLRLCLKAGFAGERCLELFDVLQAQALDAGDSEIVWGPGLDEGHEPGIFNRAGAWTWRRLRGYPSLDDRRAHLNKLLS